MRPGRMMSFARIPTKRAVPGEPMVTMRVRLRTRREKKGPEIADYETNPSLAGNARPGLMLCQMRLPTTIRFRKGSGWHWWLVRLVHPCRVDRPAAMVPITKRTQFFGVKGLGSLDLRQSPI